MASWFRTSSKGHHVALPTEDSHRLLPTNGNGRISPADGDDEEIELEMSRFATEERRPWWPVRLRRHWQLISFVVVGFFVFLAIFHFASSGTSVRGPPRPYPFTGNASIDALFYRQSSSVEQAMARYSLRNNRPPPPNYEQWYMYARDHSCLIDEYDQIYRDFEPFYQLAKEDPTYFRKMVDKASTKIRQDGLGMNTGSFHNGRFSLSDNQGTLYTGEWPNTFKRFAHFMPDMHVMLNGRDEPRVIFNTRLPNALPKALNVSDEVPFEKSPHPTASFYKDEMQCLIPNRPKGFTGLANDASAFMLYSSSTQLTTDLYPMMSMTKITPCFADILVPSEFYYSDSYWSPHYAHPNNINWTDKIPQLYWRGMTSGGWIYDDNYHAFPRFRLIDIAREHKDIMNVALSAFHDSLCAEHCDGNAIKAEYDITGASSPREEVYKFKYLFDVDGNSFSGRYLGLLRSGSLVFKSTVFSEYFNDWLRPYEHYIPILPDLSDLVEKLEWAITHDDEARVIQQAGQAFADRVITDAQNDCYFSLVLLEWARLHAMTDEAHANE
ncbi:glycosyl transferase family 90-domain-containing protein [Mycena galericulata]|nr:glycosyl transferase family 90-domain-containing protein [Mycena galericulata]